MSKNLYPAFGHPDGIGAQLWFRSVASSYIPLLVILKALARSRAS